MREFPHGNRFAVNGVYLNSAFTHPMSIASARAVRRYVNDRMGNRHTSDAHIVNDRNEAKMLFARLINCESHELAWVQSTMVGENLVLAGLGLPRKGAHIVTDAAHFEGSLYLYQSLREDGVEVTVVPLLNNRIRPEDIGNAIRPNTKLVALSQVSALTGFEHDVTAVCEVAHSRGVPVYADIIQAAGAIPIDVRASKVDFCACSTYKWLMGDFGVGFLYVRGDRLNEMRRSQRGYRQLRQFGTHFLPYEPACDSPISYVRGTDASALFEVGTQAGAAVAALKVSLAYLLETDVRTLQSYRKPMMDRLQDALPLLGFEPLTPRSSSGPIVSFAYEHAPALKPFLEAAQISIQVYQHRFRISPSVFNSMDDIEQLIDVLSNFKQKVSHE